jgi:protein gp37
LAESSIEWTQHTWNPVTGCTKLSPGCKNCYAESMARRLKAMGAAGYDGGFELALHPERLNHPLSRRAPTTYFVNSMSDLFHDRVPDSFIDKVLDVCLRSPQHTFQVLTKRAERLPGFFESRLCPPNVWLGVSVEDRRYGVPRIAELAKVKARVRFLSVEPLLEDVGALPLRGIHWVIVGGESGPRARPMELAWAQSVLDQCRKAGVRAFMKQLGARPIDANGDPIQKRDRKGAAMQEWPRSIRIRQLPAAV